MVTSVVVFQLNMNPARLRIDLVLIPFVVVGCRNSPTGMATRVSLVQSFLRITRRLYLRLTHLEVQFEEVLCGGGLWTLMQSPGVICSALHRFSLGARHRA